MRCPVCSCFECYNNRPCVRDQTQPDRHHKFSCAMCGCTGNKGSERYDRTEKGETPSMDLSRYVTERLDFLKPQDVGTKKDFKVTAVREAPRGMRFSDLLVDVQNGNKRFTVGLSFDSVMLSQIATRLGKDTDRWTGKTLTFVTATYVPKKGKNKGKKTKILNVA